MTRTTILVVTMAAALTACSGKGSAAKGPPGADMNQAPVAGSIAAPGGESVPLATKLELPTRQELAPLAGGDGSDAKGQEHGPTELDYNPDALAKSLGSDVAASFHFVRDQIRFEAYSGLLRDSDGALAARAGNSVDRSRLLARMLSAVGVRTRFATCDLPQEQAQVLFEGMFAKAPTTPVAYKSPFMNRVVRRAQRDFPVVRSAIGNRLVSAGRKAREQALNDIRTHVWVQANIDKRWTDLDSAFADAEPGKTYCTAFSTVDAIPPEWQQQVTIRVVVEHVVDSALQTDTVLETKHPAAELVQQAVFLSHNMDRGQAGGIALAPGAAGAPAKWAPVLTIAGESTVGQPFTFEDEAPQATFADALSGGSGVSAFIAEWIEFEIQRPDGMTEKVQRMVVDRGGPAWRNSTNVDLSKLRPLERDPDGPLAAHALHNLVFSAGHGDLLALGRGAEWISKLDPSKGKLSDDDNLYPVAMRGRALSVWTDQVIVPSLNDTAGVRFYEASPRISIVSFVPAKGGKLSAIYDLRSDQVFGVARDSSTDALIADKKLWFAILEGALEHESVTLDALLLDGNPASTLSTSALLGPTGVVALAPADLDKIPTLTTNPDKMADLDVSLQTGNVAVVPRQALGDSAWGYWEVAQAGDAHAKAFEGLHVSYNPIPRPPPTTGGRIFIPESPPPSPRPNKSIGGGGNTRRSSSGTEYLSLVRAVNIMLSGAVAIGTVALEVHRMEARYVFEAEQEAREQQWQNYIENIKRQAR